MTTKTAYEVAKEWLAYYDYQVTMTSGDKTWVCGTTHLDWLPGHVTVALEVNIHPDNSFTFTMSHITSRGLELTRKDFSGLENVSRFRNLEDIFFDAVEALYSKNQLT